MGGGKGMIKGEERSKNNEQEKQLTHFIGSVSWLSCTYISHSHKFLYQSLKKAAGKQSKRMFSKKEMLVKV